MGNDIGDRERWFEANGFRQGRFECGSPVVLNQTPFIPVDRVGLVIDGATVAIKLVLSSNNQGLSGCEMPELIVETTGGNVAFTFEEFLSSLVKPS